jgi:hypothetical protein
MIAVILAGTIKMAFIAPVAMIVFIHHLGAKGKKCHQ